MQRRETNCKSGLEECKEDSYKGETNGIGRVDEKNLIVMYVL